MEKNKIPERYCEYCSVLMGTGEPHVMHEGGPYHVLCYRKLRISLGLDQDRNDDNLSEENAA